jgi:hypothetical protein
MKKIKLVDKIINITNQMPMIIAFGEIILKQTTMTKEMKEMQITHRKLFMSIKTAKKVKSIQNYTTKLPK